MKTSSSILYFPSIEFRDPNWLKASLLIWDRVYRIAPKAYDPQDCGEVRAAVDAGRIASLDLTRDELAETRNDFQKFIKALPYTPDGLDSYGQSERLHIDKIDSRLYPILEQLATRIEGGFMTLPAGLSRGYMMYLAKNAADRRNINLATDSADAWVMSGYFTQEGAFSEFVYARSDDETHGYASIAIKDLIPVDLSSVPMESILKTTEKYADERVEFRTVATNFLNEIRACQAPDHAAYILDVYGKRLEKVKSDYRSATSFLGKHTVRASLVVGVPVMYTVAAAMTDLFKKDQYLAWSSSLFFGFVAALIERNFTAPAATPPVGNFLVNLDKQMATRRELPNFTAIAEEFMND